MPLVYLDNAATTPVFPELIAQLNELLENQYWNADSLYEKAVETKNLLEDSRQRIASFLSVNAKEIIFTSGASEGNNMIIRGLIDYYQGKRRHLITTAVEHSSVQEVMAYYANRGFEVDYLRVNQKGEIDFDQLKEVLRNDTLLVSVMAVNNETGYIFPVNELADYVKANSRAFFHSDMTQALGKIPLSFRNIDFASFSAHKFGGFKGSGFIYKGLKTNLTPLIMGGQQEFNQRAGTSNVPCQLVLANALAKAKALEENQDIKQLNERLIVGLKKLRGVTINSNQGSPYIVNFSLPKLSSQIAINALANKGIMLSGQSTCSTKKHEYSRVLENMGYAKEQCRNSLRVSFWHQNTPAEVDHFLVSLEEVLHEYSL